MNIDKLQTMAYMEGFIEDFLEQAVEALRLSEDEQKIKQADELNAAWDVLSSSIRELRIENGQLETKVLLAKQALG